MSDPITREQVERLLVEVQSTTGLATAQVALGILGNGWLSVCPPYVAEFFDVRVTLPEAFRAALTRWRDELAAAESVRRVARWDAELEAYALTPIHDDGALMTHAVEDAAKARDWGYEIEGGPEPVRDWKSDRAIAAIWPTPKPAEDSPERLRERREALGLSTEQAADLIKDGWCDEDIARCEDPRSVCDPRARTRYAAALSAAEAEPERAASKPHMTPSFRRDIAVMRATGASLSAIADKYLLSLSEVSEAIGPEAQPAPEVVDVPQPVVIRKLCAHVTATWRAGGDRVTVAGAYEVDVPLALLRAMLEAIDAQQQPDPQPDLDEGWRIVSGDTAFAMPFGTIRECSGCGCLEPAAPPAPEVVDVPQPVVIRKRLAGSEHSAAWSSDEPDGPEGR